MLKKILAKPQMGWVAIYMLCGTLMVQSAYSLDIDESIKKQHSEADVQAEKENAANYAKSLKGTIELYMQSHNYPTIQDFLLATKNAGRSGQEEWQKGYQWMGDYQPPSYGTRTYGDSTGVYLAIAESNLIKSLLEKEYGLTVPFETDTIEKAYFNPPSPTYEQSIGRKPEFTWDSCASSTPTMLSSGIRVIGHYTVLSAGMSADIQGGNSYQRAALLKAEAEKDLSYIEKLLFDLKWHCEKEDRDLNGEKLFTVAYKKLLNDYASALEARLQEDQARLKEYESEKNSAESEKRAALDKDRLNKQIAIEEHLLAVRSGKIKPETIEDAKLLWQPSNGIQVVLTPPVKADSRTYIVSGKLVRVDGDNYIFEVNTGNDFKYFSCAIKNNSVQGKGTSLRFESGATMVGRFVNVTSYTTVAGVTRMAPVFDVLFIQN